MDDPEFGSTEVDTNTQTILLHASNHDLQSLKPLLRIPGNASVQDPETGFTPLHAAIAACEATHDQLESAADNSTNDTGNGNSGSEEKDNDKVDLEKAKATVKELFSCGAIWNDLDSNNETPGCLAWRLGQKELYELCVEAGVRAEMLLSLMGGYEELESEDEDEEEEDQEMGDVPVLVEAADDASKQGDQGETNGHTNTAASLVPAEAKKDVNSEDYLKSELTFEDDKLLDEDANGVMMAWETDIMKRTVDLLLPASPSPSSPHNPETPDPDPNTNSTSTSAPPPGKRILNIGFGMGIIDRLFRATTPLTHHIIEAHPSVLQKLSSPDSDFSTSWQASAPPNGGEYIIHKGKWQDIVPQLLEKGEVFDAIYFDTFGEDYGQLKMFFTEYIPGLLDERGRFGWFNGLGADRRVCYDVYCKVAELHCCEAGLDVEWVDVDVEGLGGEGEGEWKGVRRRYWTLDRYRLPVCTFLG